MQGVKSTEYDGKLRTLFEISCLGCGIIKLVPKHVASNRKFCNIKCRSLYRVKNSIKNTAQCAYCNKQIFRTPSKIRVSRSGLSFCNRLCKENAQSLESGILSVSRYTTGIHNYREKAFKMLESACISCGYNEYIEMLDIDHIDGNRDNNKIDNLQVLCVWCHALKTRMGQSFNGRTLRLHRENREFNSPLLHQ